jgi:hypothetical protein
VITPGNSGSPDVFTGQSAGTLLATLQTPFSIIGAQGTLDSAVYRESGGTLDFYYQVNMATGTGFINFNNDFGFTGYTTDIGYRTDGSSLIGTGFVDGSNAPNSLFRATDRVAFGFAPTLITAGHSSRVLEIQTRDGFHQRQRAGVGQRFSEFGAGDVRSGRRYAGTCFDTAGRRWPFCYRSTQAVAKRPLTRHDWRVFQRCYPFQTRGYLPLLRLQ